MFAAGEVTLANGMHFTCETKYPYDFTICYKIEKGGRLAIRIPDWSKTFTVCVNDKIMDITPENGYLPRSARILF